MVRVENINKQFPGFALKDITITVEKGDFFTLLGPTGSGKTLILETIAGLIKPDSGRVYIEKKNVSSFPPERRGIGIVYQDSALFPHLTVKQNVTYGLRFLRKNRGQSDKWIKHLSSILRLDPLQNRFPHTLSGGEKQKVAIARALAIKPRVLLLDEPFSSLDTPFREELRMDIKKIHRETKTTFILVTHDLSEALSLGKSAAIIHGGQIEQCGKITEIFYKPRSAFVAQFVGMRNIIEAEFHGEEARAENMVFRLSIEPKISKGYLAVRPEHVSLKTVHSDNNKVNCFTGKIAQVIPRGFCNEAILKVNGLVIHSLYATGNELDCNIREGTTVQFSIDPECIHCF